MTPIFADSGYYVALLLKADQGHNRAIRYDTEHLVSLNSVPFRDADHIRAKKTSSQ